MLLDIEVYFKIAKMISNICVKVILYTKALCVRTSFYEIISLMSMMSFLKMPKFGELVFIFVQTIVTISMIPFAK